MDRIELIALLGGTGLILFGGHRLLAVPVELTTEKSFCRPGILAR